MPFAFDLGRYSTDFNPLAGGTFVNIGDVMNAYGDVFQEVIALLPKLLQMLEELSTQDIIQLLEVGLDAFLQLLFPLDGSLSPLIKALIDVLTNAATSGELWTQMINLAIQLGPQIFMAMENVITGGTAADLLAAFITLFATVLTSNTALLQGFGAAAPILEQLISAGGGTGNTLADFGGLFSALSSIAVTGITGLASGVASWLSGGGALPGATTLGAGQLSGLATGIASWLGAGGALPGGVTLPGSQLTGTIAAALISGVLDPANIPALALSAITGLPGYLTNLTSGGVLSPSGIGAGALPAGITLPGSQLTGLAAGIASWLSGGGALPGATTLSATGLTGLATGLASWLTAGGALPGATTLGAGQLSGLATGIASWLGAGGALPGGATLGAGQLTGLATGLASWLTAGGALPGGVTLPGAQLTGSVAASLLTGTIAAGLLPLITPSMTSGLAPIDTLVNAWGGGGGSGFLPTDLDTYARQLPNTVMQGLLGGVNVGNTIQNFVDSGVQGINSSTTTGNSLPVFQSALSALASYLGYKPGGTPAATSVAGVGTSNNAFITNMAASKPTAAGIDPSTDAPYNLDVVLAPATIPTVGIVDKASVGAFITTPHGGNKQSVRWLGYPTGGTMANLNGFYINIWKYNPNTPNKMTPVHQSGNLNASVGTGTSPVWNSYNLPSSFTASQGDVFYVDISVYGTGTYNIAGYTNSQILTTGAPPQSQGGGSWYGPDQTCEAHALSTALKSGVGSNIFANITFDEGADSGIIIATTTSIAATNFSVTVGAKAATRLGAVNVGAAGGPQVALWWMANPPDTVLTAGANTVRLTCNVATSWYGCLNAVNIWGAADVAGIISQVVTGGNVSKQLTGATNQDWDQQWYVALASNATTHTPGGYPASPNGGVLVSASNIANVVPLTLGYSDMFEFATITATRTTGGASMIAVPVFTNRVMATGLPTPRGLPYNGVTNAAPFPSNFYYDKPSPWIGLSGVAGATTYNPVLTPVYGSQTMTNPNTTFTWANYHDVIVCGAGGGGKGGQPGYYPAFGGAGGTAGGWSEATLTRAQMGSSALTWAIGSGGAGSPTSNTNGANGGASSVTVPGYGTVSGAGGIGATGNTATGNNLGSGGAASPGLSYNGQFYPGGPGGAAPSGWGSQPGGGGAGGNASGYGNQNGGNGGPGIGWLYSYQ